MTVYMRVSRDKYELPEVVSDSIIELANMCHINWRSIYKAVYNSGRRYKGRPGYVAVSIEEGAEDD